MSRAVSIRSQLKKYMQRFNLPLESCEGDAKRLRRCLVSGYWRNGARWVADGTYLSVRGNKVRETYAKRNPPCLSWITYRHCMCILHPYSSRGNQGQDGLSFMRWRKPKRHSKSSSSFWPAQHILTFGRSEFVSLRRSNLTGEFLRANLYNSHSSSKRLLDHGHQYKK